MNKGTVSDIKPGMLVKLEVSAGPNLGIVYHADTDIFNVLLINNGMDIPACIGADEIICAWSLSQLPTYVINDLLQGCLGGWKSILDNAVVYRSISPEDIEMTIEEISELISKQLGKPVTVTVKESESCESECDKNEDEDNDYSESDRIEVAVGCCIKRDGVTYRCVEDVSQIEQSCVGCAFYEDELCTNITCSAYCREDDKSVHFIKVSDTSEDSKNIVLQEVEEEQ